MRALPAKLDYILHNITFAPNVDARIWPQYKGNVVANTFWTTAEITIVKSLMKNEPCWLLEKSHVSRNVSANLSETP
jgi:hypothetical protein